MKKMKFARVTVAFVVFILIIMFLVMIVYGLVNLGDAKDEVFVTYMVTLISFIVSVIALLVALKTFFSIDSVNSITSMEGNVLENVHYSVSYPEAIHTLSGAEDEQGFTSIVLSRMDFDRTSTRSCVEYADWLQKIIDNLVWLAYVDLSSAEYRKGCENLKKEINNELRKYESLSNGIQYVLSEHVKLIEDVMTYIEWSGRQSDENLGAVSKLEDVRGGMIENPVSRTVYYDYLGLNYHKKARSLIVKKLKSSAKECEADFYNEIMKTGFDDEQQKQINAMLKRSISAFDIAVDASANDLLWAGYIKYNQARVLMLRLAIDRNLNDTQEEMGRLLDEVIQIREDIKYLYAKKDSYLESKLKEEIQRAISLRNAFHELLNSNV